MRDLSFEDLPQMMKADFATGKLFWLRRPSDMFKTERDASAWNTRYAGTQALTTINKDGYYVGHIRNRKYLAHRVIWALFHGRWPNQIDHINGDRLDNRIENLRSVSVSENARNHKRSVVNATGVTGVCWNERLGMWHARISHEGRDKHLGYFHEFEDAVARRKAAEVEYGFHPNHGRAA